MTTYQTKPGTFLAWGVDNVRLGHSDSPLDLREVTPAVADVLSRFSRPATVDQVVAELAHYDAAATRSVIDNLVTTGLLQTGAEAETVASLRVAAMEVPRAPPSPTSGSRIPHSCGCTRACSTPPRPRCR
ncbi:hypothetical protein ACQP1G_25035 [Nocardia sp. CA-107356]|uniref:hypothetical protein n=1 Tax=Nocardia sp. CA-107356 TaxID=3239972 RepID=UPI003D8DB202